MEEVDIKTKLPVVQNACDVYSWRGGFRGMLSHREEELEHSARVIEALLGRNKFCCLWCVPYNSAE